MMIELFCILMKVVIRGIHICDKMELYTHILHFLNLKVNVSLSFSS